MVQATKPTNSPISQTKIILPPKISEPKTQLEFAETTIKKNLKKTLKFIVKKLDILSPTVDDLRHPIVMRDQNLTAPGSNEVAVPLPPGPVNSQSEIKLHSPTKVVTPSPSRAVTQTQSSDSAQTLAPAVTQTPSQAVTLSPSPAVTLSPSKGDSPPAQQVDLNVLPPLSQTENQNSNEPPPPTYLHPAPGAAPPINPLTPIPTNISNPSAPQFDPSANNQTVSKKKLVGYFVVGFLFNLLFCVPIVLWLALKSRNGTKQKFLAYLIGVFGSFIIMAGLNYFLIKLVTTNNPSLTYIPVALSNQFPDMKFGTTFLFYNSISIDDGSNNPIKKISINVSAPTNLSPEMFKQIGTTTCRLLEEHNESYSSVIVNQVGKKSILFFKIDTSINAEQTCQEWYNQPPPNINGLFDKLNLPPS